MPFVVGCKPHFQACSLSTVQAEQLPTWATGCLRAGHSFVYVVEASIHLRGLLRWALQVPASVPAVGQVVAPMYLALEGLIPSIKHVVHAQVLAVLR